MHADKESAQQHSEDKESARQHSDTVTIDNKV
jgi:hypothetical protein